MPKPLYKRPRRGSIDDIYRAAWLPTGPSTRSQLFQWPYTVNSDTFTPDEAGSNRFQRFKDHVRNGLLGVSDFSGWESQAEGTRLGQLAFEQLYGSVVSENESGKCRGFFWVRSCDNNKVPQQILMYRSKLDCCKPCVFIDVFDKLPQHVQDVVRELSPTKSSTRAESAELHDMMQQFLLANPKLCYPDGRTAYCLQHRRFCPIHPSDGLSFIKQMLDPEGPQLPTRNPNKTKYIHIYDI